MIDLRDVSASFVCQAGDLEIKALLLAASIRRIWGAEVELVAAVPQPPELWGVLEPDVVDALEALNVHIQAVHNPWQREYPIGNKVAAATVQSKRRLRLVLDTDLLCCNVPDLHWPDQARFLAKPADFCTWGGDVRDWQAAYAIAGLENPPRRVVSTVSGAVMWPYFNSGVVAWKDCPEFADVWVETCRELDAHPDVANKRPWIDQIGLPVAIHRLGGEFATLPERWNFPAHAKTLPEVAPVLVHYHWPEIVARDWRMAALVDEVSRDVPALRTRLEVDEKWREVLLRAKRPGRYQPNRQEGPDFLVTGLPRSGTSLLCQLLHEQENCVVLNEPAEIFEPLCMEGLPHGLRGVHANFRRDIALGKPVMNKVEADGKVVSDTAKNDQRSAYMPAVNPGQFLLGSKNTIAYLSRLADLRAVMPDVPVIAAIRHPFATIDSWGRTFAHLKTADVQAFPVGGCADPRLDRWQIRQLQNIVDTTDARVRRALLWRYLAEQLLRFRDRLLLVRHEDLVADPGREMARIWSAVGAQTPLGNADGMSAQMRKSAVSLPCDEQQIIADICADVAAQFAYLVQPGVL